MIIIEQAISKIKEQAGEDQTLQMMAQQIEDHITSVARAQKVLDETKNLAECKKQFDQFASTHKKGYQSIVGPKDAQEIIYKYFGFDEYAGKADRSNVIDLGSFLDF